MTEITEEFSPNIIGEIDDGPFGKVPLYFAEHFGQAEDIYYWRQENDLAESDDGTDEFFFLCANDSFGTEGTAVNHTVNNITKGANLFVPPKINEEFILLYKAYWHLAGIFIEPVVSKDLGVKHNFDSVYNAFFNLPKIPYEMVSKLDAFFRDVDKKYGTEGIVLLTYDFDYKDHENPSLGWGFGVPDQKNTGTHCDYDKSNVLNSLEGNTRIVGTVHSHPGMAAYASQTDHNDQAGFDGIHITFGWSSKTNNETEYHVELVRGNNFTRFEPNQVMDLESQYFYTVTDDEGNVFEIHSGKIEKTKRIIEINDQEISDYLQNVEKAWSSTGSYNKHYQNNTTNKSQAGGQGKALPPVGALGAPSSIDLNSFLPENLPSDKLPNLLQNYSFAGDKVPDPRHNNVLIRVLDTEEGLDCCPLCSMVWATPVEAISGFVEERRQCFGCGVFILFGDETLEAMDYIRTVNGYISILHNHLDFSVPTIAWDFRDRSSSKIEFEVIRDGDSKKV